MTLIEFLGITSPTKVISEIYREAEMDYWEVWPKFVIVDLQFLCSNVNLLYPGFNFLTTQEEYLCQRLIISIDI